MALHPRRRGNPYYPKPRHRMRWVVILLLVGIAVGVEFYISRKRRQQPPAPADAPVPAATTTQPAGSIHLLLGNPSSATTDPSNRDNYLMVKPYYALSYNNSRGTANWVSWRVASSDLGDAPRQPSFDADVGLPAGFVRIVHKDYSGSGFDRGHLCPHADRDATAAMSASTFVMTNIIPQAPNVNEKAWARLESYCRRQVRRRHHLYIIAGPTGIGGRGLEGYKRMIAGGKVTVPAACWKIIVIVPETGGDDLAKINAQTRTIAVIMPNDNSLVDDQWAGFRTSIAEIERRTGYHFFDRLPMEVAQVLKEKVDRVRVASMASDGRESADVR